LQLNYSYFLVTQGGVGPTPLLSSVLSDIEGHGELRINNISFQIILLVKYLYIANEKLNLFVASEIIDM
jgi:hypothetical protein